MPWKRKICHAMKKENLPCHRVDFVDIGDRYWSRTSPIEKSTDPILIASLSKSSCFLIDVTLYFFFSPLLICVMECWFKNMLTIFFYSACSSYFKVLVEKKIIRLPRLLRCFDFFFLPQENFDIWRGYTALFFHFFFIP